MGNASGLYLPDGDAAMRPYIDLANVAFGFTIPIR
jgi:hypothetical protein